MPIEFIYVKALFIAIVCIISIVFMTRRHRRERDRLEDKVSALSGKGSALQRELGTLKSQHNALAEAIKQDAKGWPPNIDENIPPKPIAPKNPVEGLPSPCSCANGSGYGCTGDPGTCINYEEDRYKYEAEMDEYKKSVREWEEKYSDELVRLQALKRTLDACRKS